MDEKRTAAVLAQHYWDRFDGCACGVYVGNTDEWSAHAAAELTKADEDEE